MCIKRMCGGMFNPKNWRRVTSFEALSRSLEPNNLAGACVVKGGGV